MADTTLPVDETYVRGMELLVSVSQELSRSRKLEDLQHIVRLTATKLTGADGITIHIRDGENCFTLDVDQDSLSPWKGLRSRLVDSISGWVILNALSLIIEDVQTDPRVLDPASLPVNVVSAVLVPIRNTDPIGVIGIYWADRRVTSPAEIKLLEALADCTAIALENIRLYQELETRIQERTAALESAQKSEKALFRVQEQLRQTQKMEAVGLLAAGVAHDFNNVLTVILSYGILVQNHLPPNDPLREDMAEIITAGERAAALTKQLLAFSKQQHLEPQVISLSKVLSDSVKMLGRLLGHDIEFNIKNEQTLYTILADPHQIEQVLLNLTVNARDAMPLFGRLDITTFNVSLKEHEVTGLSSGDYVALTVTDTGIGMSPEVKDRIFEPFFTTKEMGTGLGLSTVYGIVKQSGGHITVTSQLHQGSTFTIYFQRHDGVLEPVTYQHSQLPGGTETILVVEVEPRVRQVTCRILRRAGYTVLEAPGALESLDVLDRHDQDESKVTLIITDCTLPGQSGLMLAQHFKAHHPDVRVIWISGVVPTDLFEAGYPFLVKPLTPTTLLLKVRQVLDSPNYGNSVIVKV